MEHLLLHRRDALRQLLEVPPLPRVQYDTGRARAEVLVRTGQEPVPPWYLPTRTGDTPLQPHLSSGWSISMVTVCWTP